MAKLQMGAQERMELLAYLETLLGCVKSLQASVGEVMDDVAAMRSSVFEDSVEMASCKTWQRSRVGVEKPWVQEALRSYDDLLEVIGDSPEYKN